MKNGNWGFLILLLLGLAAASILAVALKVAVAVLLFGVALLFKTLVVVGVIAILLWLLGGWGK